jgi:hypothetical protein
MAISRMQEPQQIQSGIGSLQDPRQRYFLGKLVKKAGRAVKKITKSPLGKAALLGLGGYALGGGFTAGGFGSSGIGRFLKGAGSNFIKGKGKMGALSNLFRTKDALGNYGGFDTGKVLLGGLGATALAAPFLMGGGDDEDEGPVETMDPAYQTQRARNYYSGAGDAGAGLDFMPQKKYVMQNFYAANGGRAGYANGMLVEDEEEEFIRSGAGQRIRPQQTFLNMGGGAGEAQAEQMLMMEYVKYKNKGGNLSFEQFVQAVMQASQQPEGAGMEQPMAMAADGGLMTQVPGYGKEPGTNQFDYPSGGDEVRVGKQEGGIMEAEASEMIDMGGMEKDYRNEGGFVAMGGKERADDVPARLSKNEFVFTADAVRNAGGGDIDKGAEVMENLMSNLEQGGEISEESQGLEGAQAMYDQQQMLQSRVV